MNNSEMIIENNGEGFEVACDGCDMLFGWVPTEAELPKELLLCKHCTPDCCTTERLLDTNNKAHWALIGHREEADRMSKAEYERELPNWVDYDSFDDCPF